MKNIKSTIIFSLLLFIALGECFGQYTLIDDFEQGNINDWTILDQSVVSSTAEVYSGSYSVKLWDASSYSEALHNTFEASYGIYETMVYITGSSTDTYFMFQYQDVNNYYYVAMLPLNTDNPKLILRKILNGNPIILSELPPTFGINEWIKLTIKRYCNGDIDVFINDDLKISENDNSIINQGKIGLKSFKTASYFDDISFIPFEATTPVLPTNISICNGQNYILDPGVAVSYLWQDNSINQTYNVTSSGHYYVIVEDVSGCIYFEETNVTVSPIVELGNDTTICKGDTIILDAGYSDSTYYWQDGSINQTLNVTQQGIYSVTVTNSYGCSEVDSIDIEFYQTNNYIESYTICNGDSILWIGNYYNSPGVYFNNYTSVNGCDSIHKLVLTINIVDISVTQNGDTLTANEVGATYQWLYCDSSYAIVTGETNQTFIPTSNGNYAVIVSKNNCIDTSACYVTSIDNIENNANIKIYPNPTTGLINVEAKGIESLEVFDIYGKEVLKSEVRSPKHEVDLSSQSKGIYIIKVTTNKGVAVEKIVLE